MDEYGKEIDWLFERLQEMKQAAPDIFDSPAAVAQTDQFKAEHVELLNSMLKEVRKHHASSCGDSICVGAETMGATLIMTLRDPKSILASLWVALDRLARMPDPVDNLEFMHGGGNAGPVKA
ncbi:MAG TPA: hypothetical protein VFQ06_15530 [Nitrospira sp.]|nr:hypothetical protein [Nitrospira sp.]